MKLDWRFCLTIAITLFNSLWIKSVFVTPYLLRAIYINLTGYTKFIQINIISLIKNSYKGEFYLFLKQYNKFEIFQRNLINPFKIWHSPLFLTNVFQDNQRTFSKGCYSTWWSGMDLLWVDRTLNKSSKSSEHCSSANHLPICWTKLGNNLQFLCYFLCWCVYWSLNPRDPAGRLALLHEQIQSEYVLLHEKTHKNFPLENQSLFNIDFGTIPSNKS